LIRSFHDEEILNQRAAARAIGALKPDRVIDAVVARSLSALDVQVRAAALEALVQGWPNHPMLERALEYARCSLTPALQWVSAFAAIQRGTHSDAEFEVLIYLARFASMLDHYRQQKIPQLLAQGWRGDRRLKRLCLDIASKGRYRDDDDRKMDYDTALYTLILAFPHDRDVGECLAAIIDKQDYPFPLSGIFRANIWAPIAKHFADIPDIVAATDKWMAKQKFNEHDVSQAALVGRTDVGRQLLTKAITETDGA